MEWIDEIFDIKWMYLLCFIFVDTAFLLCGAAITTCTKRSDGRRLHMAFESLVYCLWTILLLMLSFLFFSWILCPIFLYHRNFTSASCLYETLLVLNISLLFMGMWIAITTNLGLFLDCRIIILAQNRWLVQ